MKLPLISNKSVKIWAIQKKLQVILALSKYHHFGSPLTRCLTSTNCIFPSSFIGSCNISRSSLSLESIYLIRKYLGYRYVSGVNVLSRPGNTDQTKSDCSMKVNLVLMRSRPVQETSIVRVSQRS